MCVCMILFVCPFVSHRLATTLKVFIGKLPAISNKEGVVTSMDTFNIIRPKISLSTTVDYGTPSWCSACMDTLGPHIKF